MELYCEKCNRVWYGKEEQCCCRRCDGNVVHFDIETHGRSLIGNSNAWITVWESWKNHPTVREVANEHAQDGNFSAAIILSCAIERMNEKE